MWSANVISKSSSIWAHQAPQKNTLFDTAQHGTYQPSVTSIPKFKVNPVNFSQQKRSSWHSDFLGSLTKPDPYLWVIWWTYNMHMNEKGKSQKGRIYNRDLELKLQMTKPVLFCRLSCTWAQIAEKKWHNSRSIIHDYWNINCCQVKESCYEEILKLRR